MRREGLLEEGGEGERGGIKTGQAILGNSIYFIKGITDPVKGIKNSVLETQYLTPNLSIYVQPADSKVVIKEFSLHFGDY